MYYHRFLQEPKGGF